MKSIALDDYREKEGKELLKKAFEKVKELYKGKLKFGQVIFQIHNGECVRVLVEPRVRIAEFQNEGK